MTSCPITHIFRFCSVILFGCLPLLLFCQTWSKERQLGVAQLQKGLFLEALHTLNDAIHQDPGASDLYFLRGYAKYGLDDYLGAENDYTRSLELFPYQPEVLVNRAVVRSQQQKFGEAFEDFNLALQLDSTNSDIYINRARVNLYARHFDACINDCYRAIGLNCSDELVYLLKGSAEMSLGNYFTAIASFQKVLEKNPENPFGPIQMGAAWMELNRPDSAIFYLDRAVQTDSGNIYALFNRALARVNQSDWKGALEDLNRVIFLSPYNSFAYFNRAIILNEKKETGRAIRDLTTVIRLNPDNLLSYYYRGLLRAETNDLPGALEDFTKVTDLYPDYADAYFARAGVKERMKERQGAARDHQLGTEAAKRNQNRPDTLDFDEKNRLRNLIKLTGTFEEMNTMSSKIQNQYIDIRLAPVFNLFYGSARYDQIRLYDSYPREHYYSSIISLANDPTLINDSVLRENVGRQTVLLDSVSRNPESFLIRAVACTGLKEYTKAIQDCDSALWLDPGFVLPYFARGNARYGYYQHWLEELQEDRLPGTGVEPGSGKDSILRKEEKQLVDAILSDYHMATLLDPAFPYSWFNRGVLLAGLGKYQEAAEDFRRTVSLKPNFSEGYYNLGLLCLLMKDKSGGCKYLSMAGELGVADAYKVMKRHCFN